MENQTFYWAALDPYGTWQWILHQISTCFFAVCELYVFICLLVFEIRGYWRRSSSGRFYLYHPKPTWLSRFTIISCGFALFKCLSNEIDLIFGIKYQAACQVMGVMALTGYGGAIFFNTLIMWWRQAEVQKNPVLENLPLKKLRIYGSWFLLGFMFVVFGILLVLTNLTLRLIPSPYSCLFDDHGTISQFVRSLSGLFFTLLFQPAFAALLLYPLLKKVPLPNNSNMPGRRRIRKIIRRTLIALFIITASDLVVVVAAFFLQYQPAIWLASLYDLNSFLGLLAVIYPYSDWKERLRISYCWKKMDSRRKSRIVRRQSV